MTEAKRKANAKWAKKNMTCLSCSLTKADAAKYKALAAEKGLTIQAVLKAALKALEN